MKITRPVAVGLLVGSLALSGGTSAQASVPREYQDALASAQTYVKVLDISKKGLYDQLTSEYGGGFPAKAANYALQHVEVDYKSEALAAAKSYQKLLHLSRAKIFEQLVSKYGGKFTKPQAKYALAHLPK